MTNFHCRKCGSSVQGTGSEKHWLCSKCRNAALTKERQELIGGNNENEDRDIKDTNKGLIKLIKKLKGFVEDEKSSESKQSGIDESNDPDFIPSSVTIDNRQKVKRKLTLGLLTVPKKKEKKQTSTPESSDPSNDSDDDRDKNTSSASLESIKFNETWKGSSRYFPGQPFDDDWSKCEGTEKEKIALAKKLRKEKME